LQASRLWTQPSRGRTRGATNSRASLMGWFLRARARARGIGIIRKTAAAATGRPFVLNNDRGNRALIPLFADCFPSPPPLPSPPSLPRPRQREIL
jgi:hypothetical protein